MDLLFSFLEPNRPHSALLAGYFSKVCSAEKMDNAFFMADFMFYFAQVFSCLLIMLFGVAF